MKDQIIKLIEKGPKTFNDIKKELCLNSFNDSKKLDKLLRELWNEKRIFYKKTNNTYHIKDSEEIIGEFRETKNDYAFVESEELTVFIPGKFVLNSLNKDTVKVILFPLRENDDPNRRAGKVVRVMQRNGSAIIGRVHEKDGKNFFVPDDLVPKYKYYVKKIENRNVGEILLTKFIDFSNGIIKLKIIKVIGSTEDATLDSEIISYKFELNTSFNENILNEANLIKAVDSKNRRDLSERLIYTIDGDESKDLDDAIDIVILGNGNYRLGIHIADVSHFVIEGSLIDKEAEERGTSVYLIDTVFPMLPRELSNNLCSLNSNTKKFTMTCDIEINKEGKIINSEIYESKIISKHRLSYKEVDTLYNKEVKILINKNLTDSLLHAKNLSDVLRKIKISKGMIDFVLPESKVNLDIHGEVINIYNKFQTKSEKVIEDLMIITNETVASILTNNKLPGIFRVHPKPKEENLESFNNLCKTLGIFLSKSIKEIKSKDLMNFLIENKDNENIDIIKRYMIQTMEKAVYSSEDKGHFALGLENYLHFTSPIRRYPDLVVHRLIKDFFISKNSNENRRNSNKLLPYLDSISKDTSEKERIAISSERRLMDIKKSRFMKNLVGSEMKGKIVSVVKFGFFVEFENLTQGLVHIDNLKGEYNFNDITYSITEIEKKIIYKLGQKLNVKIINVDVIRGLIDLEVV